MQPACGAILKGSSDRVNEKICETGTIRRRAIRVALRTRRNRRIYQAIGGIVRRKKNPTKSWGWRLVVRVCYVWRVPADGRQAPTEFVAQCLRLRRYRKATKPTKPIAASATVDGSGI
jgi:hypothetical protein